MAPTLMSGSGGTTSSLPREAVLNNLLPGSSQGQPFLEPTLALSCPCFPHHSLARFHRHTQTSLLAEDANRNHVERRSCNPWGLHCHQAYLTRLCSEYPEKKWHRILTPLANSRLDPHRGPGIQGSGVGWGQV